MIEMKKALKAAAVAALLVALPAFSNEGAAVEDAESAVITASQQKQDATLLYTQMGTSATLSPMEDKPGWYYLRIQGVNDQSYWFTDRPVRKAGSMSMQDFVSAWKQKKHDSFKKDNPNATLVAFVDASGDGIRHSAAFQLAHPVYEKSTATMQYQVRFVNADEKAGFMKAKQPFKNIALFVDGDCPWCF